MKNVILCHESDLDSLKNGEFLSDGHNGRRLVVDESARPGAVVSCGEDGVGEELELRD